MHFSFWNISKIFGKFLTFCVVTVGSSGGNCIPPSSFFSSPAATQISHGRGVGAVLECAVYELEEGEGNTMSSIPDPSVQCCSLTSFKREGGKRGFHFPLFLFRWVVWDSSSSASAGKEEEIGLGSKSAKLTFFLLMLGGKRLKECFATGKNLPQKISIGIIQFEASPPPVVMFLLI